MGGGVTANVLCAERNRGGEVAARGGGGGGGRGEGTWGCKGQEPVEDIRDSTSHHIKGSAVYLLAKHQSKGGAHSTLTRSS